MLIPPFPAISCFRSRQLPGNRKRQFGFSLVEVMVSIVVLSLGLLGLAGLQAVSLKTSANAHLRSQSVILANDMLDRIRANSENIGSYKLTMSASAPANQATIAEKDISQWLANVAASLPGGDGSISVAGTTVTVTVEWVERTLNGEVYATQDYDLTTRI